MESLGKFGKVWERLSGSHRNIREVQSFRASREREDGMGVFEDVLHAPCLHVESRHDSTTVRVGEGDVETVGEGLVRECGGILSIVGGNTLVVCRL